MAMAKAKIEKRASMKDDPRVLTWRAGGSHDWLETRTATDANELADEYGFTVKYPPAQTTGETTWWTAIR